MAGVSTLAGETGAGHTCTASQRFKLLSASSAAECC